MQIDPVGGKVSIISPPGTTNDDEALINPDRATAMLASGAFGAPRKTISSMVKPRVITQRKSIHGGMATC
jgi:hypothetical protein